MQGSAARLESPTPAPTSAPVLSHSITAHSQQMLEGAILPMLLRMATPNAFGFFVQASVSMIEAWYIGGAVVKIGLQLVPTNQTME